MKHKLQIYHLIPVLLLVVITTSCINSSNSEIDSMGEAVTSIDAYEARKGVEKSIEGFSAALASGDALAASNFYTTDAVFMPFNAPIIVGRDSIQKALAGFIGAGFTKLTVTSTWGESFGEYYVDTEKWTLSNEDVTILGKSIVVWKKENGIWKQYKDMINTDTPEPVPNQ